MRTPLLSLGAALLLLASCKGRIIDPTGGGTGSNNNGGTSTNALYDPSFQCTPTTSITPTAIRRLAKVHYLAAIQEFMNRLSASDLSAVMGAIQTQIALLPDDASKFYSRNDTSLTEAHAGGVFELAFALGSLLASSDTYVAELASVCGAGSARASLTGSCANTFVAYYGLKSFRRAPTAAELADLLTDPTSTTTPPANLDLTTQQGLTLLLVRLLGHPRMYYRLDDEGTLVSGTDGTSGATYQLSNDELLAKLTFLFWDAPPTDALSAQVQSANLADPAQLASLLTTIVNDPRAQGGVENFYTEWLGIQSLPQLDAMNSAAYKTFAAGENINVSGHNHRTDMIQEILDMTSYYTFTTGGRYDDLMNSPYSFSRTTDLSKLYGMTSTWDGTVSGLASMAFPATQPRSGMLTRGAFLIGGLEYSDPIIKGKNIRFNVLCDVLPPPPPSVNVVPVKQDATHTTRWLVEQATAGTPSNPYQCLQCHGYMNPLGFTTEDYDSLGRYRVNELKFDPTTGLQDGSVPVDTPAVGNLFSGDTQTLQNGVDLGAYIAKLGAGQQCMVRQFFRYTFGRQEDLAQDGCSLESMRQNMVNTTGSGIDGANGTLLQMFSSTGTQRQFLYRQVQ